MIRGDLERQHHSRRTFSSSLFTAIAAKILYMLLKRKSPDCKDMQIYNHKLESWQTPRQNLGLTLMYFLIHVNSCNSRIN